MSYIAAGNTTTTALTTYGDTTGNLVFTTGGANTTALTLSNTQAATFAGAVTITGATTHTGNAAFSNITTTGSIGVGTTSPAYPIDVQTSSGDCAIRSKSNGGSGAGRFIADGNGSGSYPGISFAQSGTNYWSVQQRADTNLYLYRESGGGSVFVPGGGLYVGGSTNARFGVQGTTTDNTAQTIYLQNSAGTQLMYVRNDGYFTTGAATFSPYNYTTGLGANLYIDSNGGLVRSTSSIRYKSDVKDAYYGLQDLLKLRPVTYKSTNDGETVHGGLIAEEVDAAGLKEFVQYNADNEPDALSYGNMVSLCIKAIQELNKKVEEQAAEIKALKGN